MFVSTVLLSDCVVVGAPPMMRVGTPRHILLLDEADQEVENADVDDLHTRKGHTLRILLKVDQEQRVLPLLLILVGDYMRSSYWILHLRCRSEPRLNLTLQRSYGGTNQCA